MCKVARIKLHLQYDGTRYAGFQRQKDMLTVQGVLEDALGKLLRHPVRVKAAGRTDAGVHAKDQVVAFSTVSSIPPERIPRALGGLLPDDIIVDSAQEVSLDFDPLRDAVSKTYCYRIWRGGRLPIMAHRYVFWYPGDLDYRLMAEEASAFVGKHDFANFRALGSSAKTTVRHVTRAEWIQRDIGGQEGVLWEFWVSADGFLYKMIRLMVGTLLDIGRGYLPPGTVRAALEAASSGNRAKVGQCVPGKGLCLEKVSFS